MHDIIKEVLNEQAEEAPKERILNISIVDKNDFIRWKRRGYTPFTIDDDPELGIMFKELKLSDLPTRGRDNLKQAVFPLTDQQAIAAKKYAKPVMQSIALKRQSIETLKELFESVLYHKFMKNEFGTMNLDPESETEESAEDMAPQKIIDTFYKKIQDAIDRNRPYDDWITRIKTVNGRIPNKIKELIDRHKQEPGEQA